MKVIALKKDDGMTAVIYPAPMGRGITLIPGKDEIPAVPALSEIKQSKTQAYRPAIPEQPAIPAIPPQVMGGDGVIIPGLESVESEDDFIKRIASGLPVGSQYIVTDDSDLPNADSDFFNAWKFGPAITIDLNAAKDIQRNNLRILREPALAALDVAYNQADEKGDVEGKAAIAAKKQALRDVTNCKAIASATTTIQLRNAGLDILAANSI